MSEYGAKQSKKKNFKNFHISFLRFPNGHCSSKRFDHSNPFCTALLCYFDGTSS